MLETLNLSDVKYIDEFDDGDTEEEEGQQQQQQQKQQRQTIKETRQAQPTVVRAEVTPRSAVSAAVACRDVVAGSTSLVPLKPAYKTKPTARSDSSLPKLTKSPPRNGVRSTPPRTLQLKPCIDRHAKWTVGSQPPSLPLSTKLPVTSANCEDDLPKESQPQSQHYTMGASEVDSSISAAKDGCDSQENLRSLCAGHRFIPRHSDEVLLETGDPLDMEEEYDDLWCKGLNVRTGKTGIFPSVCVADSPTEGHERGPTGVLADSTLCKADQSRRTFVVRFLGSVEAKRSTGIEVLVDAIRKVTCHLVKTLLSQPQKACAGGGGGPAPLCSLTVSPLGVQLSGLPCNPSASESPKTPLREKELEGSRDNHKIQPAVACHEGAITNHFFPMKNITYSGRHPENSRYLGFITKHPTQQRHACHCLAIQETDSDAALLIREILLRRLTAPAGTPSIDTTQALQ